MMSDERDLRTWFDLLRESDRRQLPPFEMALARPARRVRLRLAFALAAVLVIVLIIARRPSRELLPLESLSRWQSPTASLLNVPDSPLMTTVPEVLR